MSQPESPAEPAGQPRNAAWRAGAIWACGASFFFLSIFCRMSPSVMVGDLMRDFAVNAAVLGGVSAFYLYAYAGMQIPVGITLDRFGPRRMMTVAAATAAAGALIFALAPSALVAGAGRTLIGAGCAFSWIGSMKLIAIWLPPRKFALVMGLTSMCGMAGGAVGQSLAALLVEAFGWRATQGVAALALGLVALAIWLVVRDERPGAPTGTSGRFTSRGALGVLKSPQTWIAGVIVGSVGAIMMAFVGLWAVPFLSEVHGLDRSTAAAASSMFLVGWMFGAPTLGWLSDRIALRRLPTLAGCVVSFAAVLVVIYVPGLPLWSVHPLLLVSGFAGSGSIIAFAVMREINRPENAATAVAFANLIPMALASALQPLIGWMLDRQWTGRWADGARLYDAAAFRLAFLTIAACAVASVVACVLLRETRGRVRPDPES